MASRPLGALAAGAGGRTAEQRLKAGLARRVELGDDIG